MLWFNLTKQQESHEIHKLIVLEKKNVTRLQAVHLSLQYKSSQAILKATGGI